MSNYRVVCRDPSCNRNFESHDRMTQHYLVCHSKQKKQEEKYACGICNKSKFKNKAGLQDHMRIVHLTNYDIQEANKIAPPVLQAEELKLLQNVACNDCGKTFKSVDALHQHQWASANHTRVSKSSNPNQGTRVRTCSQCETKCATPEELEQHFVEQHPISEVLKSGGEERTWQQVEDRFRSAWTKPTIKLYDVHRIFKVYNPGWRRKDFEEYRKELKKEMSNQKMIKEDNVELRNKVLADGNELQRYHGTTVKCRLGRPCKPNDIVDGRRSFEALSLCRDAECSLCRILQTGFQKSRCRVKNFQRFGKGIYTSAASSKSDAYVKCSTDQQTNNSNSGFFCCFGGDDQSTSGKGNFKVMMICRVIAGRPHHSTLNKQHLKGPPRGFHSVQGDPGEKLNYDELVVYDDRAILPGYIILYTSSD